MSEWFRRILHYFARGLFQLTKNQWPRTGVFLISFFAAHFSESPPFFALPPKGIMLIFRSKTRVRLRNHRSVANSEILQTSRYEYRF